MTGDPTEKRDSGSSNPNMESGSDRTPAPGVRIDPERLAALIDGRLTDEERRDVLAGLSRSPDDVELLADALAAEREIDPGSGTRDVLSIADAPSRKARRHWWIAAAAAVAFVSAIPIALRNGSGSASVDPGGYAAMLRAPGGLRLDTGWTERGYPALRGSSASATTGWSARLGAAITDIEVAAAVDTIAAQRIAARMATLLHASAVAVDAQRAYEDIAAGRVAPTDASRKRARQLVRQLAPVVDSAALDAGAWVRAAWIATVQHDSAFFTHSRTIEAAGRVDRLVGAANGSVVGRLGLAARGEWNELAVTLVNALERLDRSN